MTVLRLALLVAVLVWGAGTALAVQPDEVLRDPTLEARARAISQDLRCLVCQNQSIDDSNAPLARDLRILVRERLVAGDSDAAVLDFVVDRYGQYVLLRPPFNASTYGLWLGPLVVFVVTVTGFALWMRRRPTQVAAATPLSADERQRLDRILADDGR